MKCSDIPTRPILEFLAKHQDAWCTHSPPNEHMSSVTLAMPEGTPEKLVHAKMRMLLKRGLVMGCGCGCRGDWEISNKGCRLLKTPFGHPDDVAKWWLR